MRDGYRLEQRGKLDIDTLIAPNGERVAWVRREARSSGTIMSMIAGIESRHVTNGAEQRKAMGDIAEEHYRLTASRHQRFRDGLNRWVDYPIVKLIGIVAAIVAATASVLALIG